MVISECSGAVGKFREKSLSINPQKTHMFKFAIHAYGMKGGNNYCVGKEYGQYTQHLFPVNKSYLIHSAYCRSISLLAYNRQSFLVQAAAPFWEDRRGPLSSLDDGALPGFLTIASKC